MRGTGGSIEGRRGPEMGTGVDPMRRETRCGAHGNVKGSLGMFAVRDGSSRGTCVTVAAVYPGRSGRLRRDDPVYLCRTSRLVLVIMPQPKKGGEGRELSSGRDTDRCQCDINAERDREREGPVARDKDMVIDDRGGYRTRRRSQTSCPLLCDARSDEEALPRRPGKDVCQVCLPVSSGAPLRSWFKQLHSPGRTLQTLPSAGRTFVCRLQGSNQVLGWSLTFLCRVQTAVPMLILDSFVKRCVLDFLFFFFFFFSDCRQSKHRVEKGKPRVAG